MPCKIVSIDTDKINCVVFYLGQSKDKLILI